MNRSNEGISCTYEGTDGLQGTGPLLLSSGGIGRGKQLDLLYSPLVGLVEGKELDLLYSPLVGLVEGKELVHLFYPLVGLVH